MQSLTSAAIKAAMINATRGEISKITFASDLATVPWPDLDFYGWRDPRIERRGYLVAPRGDELLALLLTTPSTRLTGGRKAMCSVCRAVDDGANVALFATRRAGPAGRKGDTVGTYICAGLDCSLQLRHPQHRAGRSRLGSESDDERAAAMMQRLHAFVASVGA